MKRRKKEIIRNVLKNRGIVSEPGYLDVGAILLFIFLLPYILSFFFGNVESGKATELYQEDTRTEIMVCNQTAAGTEILPLETYLVSCLPFTINMDYEPEALKAQTVILRTGLMHSFYEKQGEGKPEENGKTYIYVEGNRGKTDGKVYEKCKEAVESTKGIYMTYQGAPIIAPYFAVSAGTTRNGNEVFDSEDYSYLKSVMCERDFTSPDYADTVKMHKSAFWNRLYEICPNTEQIRGENLREVLQIQRDKAGYVRKVSFEENEIQGEALRTAFQLNSSCFEWGESGDFIVIKTKGMGHGLGFCQYGANEAAKKGSDYIDILKYFFSDIVIEKTE